MLTIDGQAGEVMRGYYATVVQWATEFIKFGEASEEVIFVRTRAAKNVSSVFGHSIHNDTPLDAIFIAAVRRVDISEADVPTPQPYSH